MSDEREKRLEQLDPESTEPDVEAHKRLRSDDATAEDDSGDDVEAHGMRFEKRL